MFIVYSFQGYISMLLNILQKLINHNIFKSFFFISHFVYNATLWDILEKIIHIHFMKVAILCSCYKCNKLFTTKLWERNYLIKVDVENCCMTEVLIAWY